MSSPADFQKHEKSQKICLKTPVKSSCIFNANFNDFCLHFGSQNPSKKQVPLDIFSTFSPRHVQDAPRRLQDTSKTPLSSPLYRLPPRVDIGSWGLIPPFSKLFFLSYFYILQTFPNLPKTLAKTVPKLIFFCYFSYHFLVRILHPCLVVFLLISNPSKR